MIRNSLQTFAHGVSDDWGPLSTALIEAVSSRLKSLLQAAPTEEWLEDLHRNVPPTKELIRDPRHGFVLQAHTEPAGLYRPPHDHGRSWVIYAVASGESEMGTYGRFSDRDGAIRLVRRGTTRVGAGQVQVYLPGDIHDTRCLAGPALIYRFTERDLKKEDQEHHKITRFVERAGDWVAP